jgi:hypothetical protein
MADNDQSEDPAEMINLKLPPNLVALADEVIE